MNEELVIQLKNTIKDLKIEILKKQEELILLLEQYKELTGINLENDDDKIGN